MIIKLNLLNYIIKKKQLNSNNVIISFSHLGKFNFETIKSEKQWIKYKIRQQS